MRIVVGVIMFVILVSIVFFVITTPIAKALSDCLKEVNMKQESIQQKLRNKELTEEEIKLEYTNFLNDTYRCKDKAKEETNMPNFVIDAVWNAGFKGRF